jgi:hypothetical protein
MFPNQGVQQWSPQQNNAQYAQRQNQQPNPQVSSEFHYDMHAPRQASTVCPRPFYTARLRVAHAIPLYLLASNPRFNLARHHLKSFTAANNFEFHPKQPSPKSSPNPIKTIVHRRELTLHVAHHELHRSCSVCGRL